MNYLSFFILTVFAAFFQATILPFNFLLLLLVVAIFRADEPLALYLAFSAGVVRDLVFGKPFGFSSFLFLLAAGAISFLNKKFSFSPPFYPFLVMFILSLLWHQRFFEAVFLSFLAAIFTLKKQKIAI